MSVNSDILDRLKQTSGRKGFNQWLGPQGLRADAEGTELILDIRPEHCQHHGFVHGGCVAALADIACAWAGAAATGLDVVTSNFTIHYIAPAIGTRLRAKARPIRTGKRQVTVEAEIWAESDDMPPKQAAHALAGIAILGPRSE